MAQIIRIKNDTLATQTWGGKEFTAGEEHTIQAANLSKWRSSDNLVTAIANSEALVGDSSSFFSDIITGLSWLNGDVATHLADPFPDNETGYSFRGAGGTGEVTAGSNDIDILIHATEARLINGAEVWSDATAYGSYVTFQVVDVDNVLGYGAGTMVEEFGSAWQMHPDLITKAFPGYVANVPAGLYIRLKVNSTDAADIYYNLYLHKY
jgi:hypothetical protein